jgi:hypothetical protein
VTAADFELSARLEADSLKIHVPPEMRTLVEGDGVVLDRAHARHGLPAHLEPGARYSNISIERRVRGQNEGSFRSEKPRPAMAPTAAFPEGPSRGSGISPLITSPADEGAVENQDMSNDLISATKRRAAARERRRKTFSLEPQPLDEATEPSEDGASSPRDDSVSDLVAGATRSTSGRVSFGLGALIGAAAGVTAANLASRRKDVISGVVRIDLLKRVELLSIKLRLQRAAEDRLR